ncbi:MAG: hypothetical protein K2Y29_13130 [Beijerinckiaceae bacterium]|nr:hypothetical protein [Beijerinckiaceae bacterium]
MPSFGLSCKHCFCAALLLVVSLAPLKGLAANEAPFPPVVILVGFGPAQGNDQPARPDAATLASNRMSPDMSYDQTARFLARHLGRFLPGSPSVSAQHTPGGAGLVAARKLAQSRPDGSLIALLSSNIIYASALRLPGAVAPADSLVWLGGVAPDAWACIRTHASAGKKNVWAGSLGAGSRADVHARAMRDLAGYPMEIASGYVSRFELIRALENGELDAACGWPMSDLQRRREEWLSSGKMDIVGAFSATMNGPSSAEWRPEGAVAMAFEALAAEAELAWPLAAPPGTTAPTAAAFRKALEALAYDRPAVEDARRAGIALDPIEASTIETRVRQLHTLEPDVREKLVRLYVPK